MERKNLENLTKEQLIVLAKENGIKATRRWKESTIIERLLALDIKKEETVANDTKVEDSNKVEESTTKTSAVDSSSVDDLIGDITGCVTGNKVETPVTDSYKKDLNNVKRETKVADESLEARVEMMTAYLNKFKYVYLANKSGKHCVKGYAIEYIPTRGVAYILCKDMSNRDVKIDVRAVMKNIYNKVSRDTAMALYKEYKAKFSRNIKYAAGSNKPPKETEVYSNSKSSKTVGLDKNHRVLVKDKATNTFHEADLSGKFDFVIKTAFRSKSGNIITHTSKRV